MTTPPLNRSPRTVVVGAALAAAVLLGGCKAPNKKVPPIKITSITVKVEVKDHQRLLKVSYEAVNIKNNCSGGLCVATLLTKIRVYGPKGSRIQLPKKYTRNKLDHRKKNKMNGGVFWFTVPLPSDAPAGTYTVRIEADDKLRGKWDVKKTKVKVSAEPIPTLRFDKVKTVLAMDGDTQVIRLSYHAVDVYNRCVDSLCKTSYNTRVEVKRPNGKPLDLPKDKLSNKLERSAEGRISGGSFSFQIPIWGEEVAGKWTLHLELKDAMSKKRVTRVVTVAVPKAKKAKKK